VRRLKKLERKPLKWLLKPLLVRKPLLPKSLLRVKLLRKKSSLMRVKRLTLSLLKLSRSLLTRRSKALKLSLSTLRLLA
jgi:hypothetical protein